MARRLCAALLFAAAPAAAADGPVVHTSLGDVRGVRAAPGDPAAWWGIPFALPPTGARRFAPPEPAAAWSSVLDAATPPPPCPQGGSGVEDCLYLNVYAPANASGLPVLLWIYGGAFVEGDSWSGGQYDGRALTKHGVVVVSVNYRLGSLGFMALPALKAADGTTGNAGLLDQQLAMRWVQREIAAFGGDPKRVAIFGESAGGISVLAHLAMPGSKGLFSAAIAESPISAGNVDYMDYANATAFGTAFATYVGCSADDLACLRALPLNKVLQPMTLSPKKLPPGVDPVPPFFSPVLQWWPVVDGAALPARPIDAVRAGTWNSVPLMLGTNHDEGSMFMPLLLVMVPGWTPTPDGLRKAIQHFYPDPAVSAAATAPGGPYPASMLNATRVTERVVRDLFFRCPARAMLRAAAGGGGRPPYAYTFNDSAVAIPVAGDFHGAEIPLVFGNKVPADAAPLSEQMGELWASFAARGAPACSACPEWPAYDTRDRAGAARLALDQTLRVVRDNDGDGDGYGASAACDFWDRAGYNM